ncbi:MAG: GntR family transcriptional regulator [Rhodobiaceae bacterium]|nr:GntR family transcriptional regulator [Rhodobiaceae bacterium]MCC0042008.1 GntR family transcriptional regulator [Rhodobiaceae bacterium]MCC0053410.1 GntR family transcriptional regulator [Rhodobiaceae bacterium]
MSQSARTLAPDPAAPRGNAPVRRANMLRDAIAQAIATGDFKPGEHLDEVALATRYGVSRTPIREALMQLGTMGLVEMRPNRGAFVRRVSVTDMVEMFEVMAELEGMCARLAARRMSSDEIDALERVHLDCAAAADSGDPDAYYYENERFHRVLYAGCHNRFLMEEASRLHDRTKVYRRLQLRVRGRVANSFSEHEAVVAAIRAGDPDLAEKAAREHVLIQGERFTDFVASLGEG